MDVDIIFCSARKNGYISGLFMETYPDKRKPVASNSRRITLQGYNVPAEFYLPDYSALPDETDFRRTLYWNPSVMPDSTGTAKVRFYNNARTRAFVISAEGIDANGVPLAL